MYWGASTHPYRGERPLGEGKGYSVIVAGGTVRAAGSPPGPIVGQQAEEQLEGAGQPPPQRGQDGAQAQGEEPRVPWRGHVEDDGDAGLEDGRVDGGRRRCVWMLLLSLLLV